MMALRTRCERGRVSPFDGNFKLLLQQEIEVGLTEAEDELADEAIGP